MNKLMHYHESHELSFTTRNNYTSKNDAKASEMVNFSKSPSPLTALYYEGVKITSCNNSDSI